jgi:MYXO-CTERM domain-containing protein
MVLALAAWFLVTLVPSAAHADLLYDFTWQAQHDSWTFEASRYELLRNAWQDGGRGHLQLSPAPGAGPTTGQASYEVTLDGVPLGRVQLGDEPVFHPRCRQSPAYCGGTVEAAGRPERPGRLTLSFVDSSSPHCLVGCQTTAFNGAGRLIAPEPGPGFMAALALAALGLWRHRRRG